MNKNFKQIAENYLNKLCNEIPNRAVGSIGNIKATEFFEKEISSFGWEIQKDEFYAMDWESGGVILQVSNINFKAFVSPYSLGCEVKEQLVCASTIEELEKVDANGKVLLLYGEIAKEQLMPKNFVFYNPEEHQRIIHLLENKGIKAIISATKRNSALAGGVYPFPLIEDGDFNIPSIYMTDKEGDNLLKHSGETISINSISNRIDSKGYNIIARKGIDKTKKLVITAHIDAKKGTQGAIDNATGVIVLLLLANMLQEYNRKNLIEIVALNGEDYYAVPGQMSYIMQNENNFNNILLNINIDGAGYKKGKSAFSFYNLPTEMEKVIKDVISNSNGVVEGKQWVQGDHSIFIQYGRPAIAASSKWFTDNVEAQKITHTPKDNPSIVDCSKLVDISDVIFKFISEITW